MKNKFAMVTPVRNEEAFLPIAAESVLRQEVQPAVWIIINDHSSDSTAKIIANLESQYGWIHGIENTADENEAIGRRIGGQAVLHLGLEHLDVGEYDFLVRMDSDVSFDPEFFESIFSRFNTDPNLGIASGVCYAREKDRLIEERHPRFHTRGPLKVYRSQCYEEIGGLDRSEGWDTIDEVKANMLGWRTRSFPDLHVLHLRKTQTASGVLRGFRNIGKTAYYTGYHPLFMSLRIVRHMLFNRPFILGGVNMMLGWLEGYMKKGPRVDDKSLIEYLRQQQVNRIMGKKTIWK